MEAVLQELDGRVVIAVKGRLDMMTSSEFEAACAPACEGAGGVVVVDLRKLEYISSAGLRSLLVVGKRVRKTGGTMSLCVSEGLVRDVLSTANFESLFPVSDTL